MQAKLPDLNAAIVTHRQSFLISYSKKDYRKCIMSIRSVIALLPEEFSLTVGTSQYEAKKRATRKLICNACNHEQLRAKTNLTKSHHEAQYQIILSKKSRLMWKCDKCLVSNDILRTDSILEKDPDPSYYGIIPDPPIPGGLFDRYDYPEKWKTWYDIAVCELEHKISAYRTEYTSQNNDFLEGVDNREDGETEV